MALGIAIVSILTFLLNLPFGYLTSKEKKFSIKWFFFIHIPIPAIILMRHYFEIGFVWYSYPFIFGAYFLGHLFGKRYEKKQKANVN